MRNLIVMSQMSDKRTGDLTIPYKIKNPVTGKKEKQLFKSKLSLIYIGNTKLFYLTQRNLGYYTAKLRFTATELKRATVTVDTVYTNTHAVDYLNKTLIIKSLKTNTIIGIVQKNDEYVRQLYYGSYTKINGMGKQLTVIDFDDKGIAIKQYTKDVD